MAAFAEAAAVGVKRGEAGADGPSASRVSGTGVEGELAKPGGEGAGGRTSGDAAAATTAAGEDEQIQGKVRNLKL
jgi:hypothetical protein